MHHIFHITHLQNLKSILETGSLLCDSERKRSDLRTTGIAHDKLKDRRLRRPVPTAAYGVLGDYVPFYFAPRSPMLCSIHHNRVAGYVGGQEEVLHLVSTVEKVVERKLVFTFTNGHAVMETAEFFERLADLENNIDWQIMNDKYWRDTEEDNKRTWRRNAEFLVHKDFPVDLLLGIGVMSQGVADRVRKISEEAKVPLRVVLRPQWYF